MNEELIRKVAREAADAAPCDGADDYACTVTAVVDAIRLYHARHVAPLEQLAADNLKLANDAAAVLRESEQDRERLKQELTALRANVAPLVEAAMEARRIAMEQAVAARVPECGKFGDIAQDLDAALAAFGKEEE